MGNAVTGTASANSTNGAFPFEPRWGQKAPRGERTVLNRVLKEGTKVPLFLGQTLVKLTTVSTT